MSRRVTRAIFMTAGFGVLVWVALYRAFPDYPLGPEATTVMVAAIFGIVFAVDHLVSRYLQRRKDATARRA